MLHHLGATGMKRLQVISAVFLHLVMMVGIVLHHLGATGVKRLQVISAVFLHL